VDDAAATRYVTIGAALNPTYGAPQLQQLDCVRVQIALTLPRSSIRNFFGGATEAIYKWSITILPSKE
jgi:hypothetical protein